MTLTNGQKVPLTAEFLRAHAMDAVSRRERIDNSSVTVCPDIHILSVRPVGHTGLNITFSDGHDRAIYPYSYLQTLALSVDK